MSRRAHLVPAVSWSLCSVSALLWLAAPVSLAITWSRVQGFPPDLGLLWGALKRRPKNRSWSASFCLLRYEDNCSADKDYQVSLSRKLAHFRECGHVCLTPRVAEANLHDCKQAVLITEVLLYGTGDDPDHVAQASLPDLRKRVSSNQRELSVVLQWQVPMSTEVQALATIEDVTGAWQAAQPGLDSYVTEHC